MEKAKIPARSWIMRLLMGIIAIWLVILDASIIRFMTQRTVVIRLALTVE